jgi:hypothetical protein
MDLPPFVESNERYRDDRLADTTSKENAVLLNSPRRPSKVEEGEEPNKESVSPFDRVPPPPTPRLSFTDRLPSAEKKEPPIVQPPKVCGRLLFPSSLPGWLIYGENPYRS